MPILKEVRAPYTINAVGDALERQAVIVRRDGESVVVVPIPADQIAETVLTTAEGEMIGALLPPGEYAAYRAWKETTATPSPPVPVDPEFEKQWQAFQRLKPELLKKYKGQWVAIVNEEVVESGSEFGEVAQKTRERFGDVPMCVSEVLEKPRIYKVTSRKVVSHAR